MCVSFFSSFRPFYENILVQNLLVVVNQKYRSDGRRVQRFGLNLLIAPRPDQKWSLKSKEEEEEFNDMS